VVVVMMEEENEVNLSSSPSAQRVKARVQLQTMN
jgi:hypothetical protein